MANALKVTANHWIAGGVLATLAACMAADPVSPEAGRQLFLDHCAACHGAGATGDGPLAAGLSPKPADLTRIAARNGGVYDHVRVLSVIDGYNQHGRQMPGFGDLLPRSETVLVETGDGILTPTPVPLAALAAYLKTIQQP